ncbi:probable purple acid phosphatase 20 [Cannabis sativa]|uniref:probable purple acid phosphatase 20 n=1 Tax=Cannabis sativa TaxID=3483 RepID=UPI0029CA820B|nr:probable purple acid phosphatase 20 [Cannabis sativa]
MALGIRVCLFLVYSFTLAMVCAVLFSGTVQSYNRPPPRKDISVDYNKDDYHDSSPQQVHISLVGEDQMRVSWITKGSDSEARVDYGVSPGVYGFTKTGTTSSYRYVTYESGSIHDVVIGPLTPNTLYYYRCGGASSPSAELTLKTPPAAFPIKFALAGDLGQTDWTTSTLDHISKSNYDILLLPGDLSYADAIQPRWDSFGRLVEQLASQRPWMVTQGNHEVEKIPLVHTTPFTAYNSRWPMPFQQSASESNLYYSFDAAARGIHVIMLGSYTDFSHDSAQYKWLEADLRKVNRTKTPWLVVVVHAPWYNSNTAHQGEPESNDMKAAMEELLYSARVDVVFSGHVHAYERFARVYNDKADKCGPIYITIGDGGNREGLASEYIDPKPEISIFREASFGHGQVEFLNGSHAQWTWHRNQDDVAIASDSFWFTSLSFDPSCKL